MGQFILLLIIAFLIMRYFQNKGKKIDMEIAAEKHRKAEAIRKAREKQNEKDRIRELEERIEELEEEILDKE